MKRLLALLLLFVSPALYAQVDFTDAVNVPNTVVNSNFENCVSGQANCGGTGWGSWRENNGSGSLGDFTSAFGSREYVFSYTQSSLSQNIYLGNLQTNAFNFFFDFDLNNSCRNSIGGSCTNVNGPIDPFTAKIYFYDQNGLNNEFTFLSGTPSTANIVCNGLDLFGLCILGYSAQDQWQHFGWYSSVQSNSLFDYARIEFTGRDAGFWGGLYGPRIDNVTLQINYLPPPYPTVDGGAGMNVAAPGSDYIFIFKGNDPVLFSQLAILGQDIVGWTAITDTGQNLTITEVVRPDPDYLFLYTDGVPVSGTFYSFQEQPPTVDCVTDPFDPTCIIDTLGIDESPVMVADTTDESLPVEEDPAPADELLADDMTEEQLTDEETTEEESLEEMLAEESDEEEVVTEERLVVYRELSDEEKAAILADAISKNTLESALSIASDAVSSAAVSSTSEVSISSESSTKSTTLTALSVETVSTTNETVAMIESASEATKEETIDSSSTGTLDILEIGRQLGQEALAVTLAGAESSATESLNEAENVAAISSSDSVLASMNSIEAAVAITTDEKQIDNEESVEETFAEEITTSETSEIMVAENNIESSNQPATSQPTIEKEEEVVVAEVQTQETTEIATEQKDEVIVAEVVNETVVENVEQAVAEVQTEQQSAVEFTTVEEVMEVFASNINAQATAEQEELENNVVQQAIAASQQNDEDNKMGFAEAEAVTIASDPALANAFNIQPNTASLELLGVLSNKSEEKSDAEIRAEQVVAANKEQQDAINANYMDADQSGIVAAMGADTDVASYRTAMLRDNNNWYKPEDIYKGIIIKDNVRGSYFLEKGNTDTYKKMVDEQYK